MLSADADLTALGTPARSAVQIQSSLHETDVLEKVFEPVAVPACGFGAQSAGSFATVTSSSRAAETDISAMWSKPGNIPVRGTAVVTVLPVVVLLPGPRAISLRCCSSSWGKS